MGERTWGKGSVQNVIELENGRSALKLTTAAYRRPSGKNIHRFPDSKETDAMGRDARRRLRSAAERYRTGVAVDRSPAIATFCGRNPAAAGPCAPSPKRPNGLAAHAAAAADAAAKRTRQRRPIDTPAVRPRRRRPPSKPAGRDDRRRPGDPARTAGLEIHMAPFVDRQLQMAVKYLTEQLARAK